MILIKTFIVLMEVVVVVVIARTVNDNDDEIYIRFLQVS